MLALLYSAMFAFVAASCAAAFSETQRQGAVEPARLNGGEDEDVSSSRIEDDEQPGSGIVRESQSKERSEDEPSGSDVADRPESAQSDVVALPEIMVTGTIEKGVPVVPIDNIGSRNVFTPEEVRATGARDMNDLVQNLPGVSTRPYNGGEAAAPSFSTRGLPDDGLTEYIHVLIDGVPASALPYGWTAFSFLPLSVERVHAVDQIRAAHSVRYSPNTVGGVVNFITQPIPDEPEFEMRTTLGSFDYASSLLRLGFTEGKLGAQVTYVDRRGDGFRDDGEFDQQDFNLKLRYDFDESEWLALSINYFEDEHKAPGGLTQAQFDEDRFANARPLNRFKGYRGAADVVWHRDIDEDTWVEAFTYFSASHRDLRGTRPTFGTPDAIRRTEDTSYFYGLGFRAEKRVDLAGTTHTFFGGVRYHGEDFPRSPTDETDLTTGVVTRLNKLEAGSHTLSAHIDDTFSPVDNLDVTLGARVEWVPDTYGEDDITGLDYDDEFFRVLPGIGASYLLTDEWAVHASYFEGFRAPQVWGYRYVMPDDDLKFELGRTAEIGTRYLGESGFGAALALWRVEFDDYTVFVDGFYQNLGRILSHGADLEVSWEAGSMIDSLDGLSLSGSITLMDSELKSGVDRGNEVPYAWDSKAAWRARYERDTWSASVGGVAVGEAYSDSANTRDDSADGTIGLNEGWTIWDAQVAHAIPVDDAGMLDLAVGVTNLFDTQWEVHSRGGFFGGGLVAGAPRQAYVSAGLTMKF